MPRVASHTHKLKRFRYKSTGHSIFHCVLPDCFFKSETHLLLGKEVICWRCGKKFIMNEYTIRLARPHCNSCHKSKTEVVKPAVVAVAGDSLSEMKSRLGRLTDEKGEL